MRNVLKKLNLLQAQDTVQAFSFPPEPVGTLPQTAEELKAFQGKAAFDELVAFGRAMLDYNILMQSEFKLRLSEAETKGSHVHVCMPMPQNRGSQKLFWEHLLKHGYGRNLPDEEVQMCFHPFVLFLTALGWQVLSIDCRTNMPTVLDHFRFKLLAAA